MQNKARVEGSICNAHLVKEISSFASHYFEGHVPTRSRNVGRNDDVCVDEGEPNDGRISVFKSSGRSFGAQKSRNLSDMEYNATHYYILMNCRKVDPYIE